MAKTVKQTLSHPKWNTKKWAKRKQKGSSVVPGPTGGMGGM